MIVLPVQRDAVEHDADEAGVAGCVDVVVADDVGVVVVRRGVAAARIHEELGEDVRIAALLEEAFLARADVHASRAVSEVLGAVVARVRRLRL